MEWINSSLLYKSRASLCHMDIISCPHTHPPCKNHAGKVQKKQAHLRRIKSINNTDNTPELSTAESAKNKNNKKKKTSASIIPIAMGYVSTTNDKNDDDVGDAPENWTFPLARMEGMTPDRYAQLRAQAADRDRPQVCAAVVSGFTCIGKTTFGATWQPTYGRHRVVNLEFNQYRDLPHRGQPQHEQHCTYNNSSSSNSNNNHKGGGVVDSEAYLTDTLIAAKFIPGAIVVVNCHTHFRRALRDHHLDYVRVHPDFQDVGVRDAWRARAAGRWRTNSQTSQQSRQQQQQQGTAATVAGEDGASTAAAAAAAAAAAKFATRMMACWEAWSEMGTPGGFDFDSSPGVVFGAGDYLSTRIGDILEVARQQQQQTASL